MKKLLSVLLAALLALALGGCGENTASAEPPDLIGTWRQQDYEATNFYQIAIITEDRVECYWHLNSTGEEFLYWTGTFTPPGDGKEPYTWTSEIDLEKALTSNWSEQREAGGTKTFTYKDGKLSYNVNMAHLRMTYALERVE